MVSELQPSSLPTEQSHVAYVITLCMGPAREWSTAAWDSGAAFYSAFSSFMAEMRRVFDHSKQGQDTAQGLLQLQQEGRSVSQYAIQFCTLAM